MNHNAILNAAASRLTGLLPPRRPYAEQVFDAVQSDGGLTAEQVALRRTCSG
jgi:hypothetical protein